MRIFVEIWKDWENGDCRKPDQVACYDVNETNEQKAVEKAEQIAKRQYPDQSLYIGQLNDPETGMLP